MAMLVVRVRGVGMRMGALVVTVRVTVLAVERWIVNVVMMPVVVAVRVLVLDGIVRVQVAVFLGQVKINRDSEEGRCA